LVLFFLPDSRRESGVFISVIVPMWNAEPYLETCLAALAAQDYPPSEYEILLIDNRSTDRSVEIARRHERVTLLAEPVPGAYAARNRRIRAARGEILAFTDSDCAPHASWLAEIAAAMADPGLDLLCGRRLPGGPSALLSSLVAYENMKDTFVLDGGDTELYYGYSSNMAVRRQAFDRLGPFLELSRGADTLFVRRLAQAGSCAIRHLGSAVVTHLELDRLSIYYKKVFLYGRHRRRNNAILRSRPLTQRERMAIYRRAVTAGDYSWSRSALLLAALGVGSLAWFLGTASARPRKPVGAPGPLAHANGASGAP
jgi:glycosyltransferase involved in cell wall biosynthesis